jgi:hypothetical protein
VTNKEFGGKVFYLFCPKIFGIKEKLFLGKLFLFDKKENVFLNNFLGDKIFLQNIKKICFKHLFVCLVVCLFV